MEKIYVDEEIEKLKKKKTDFLTKEEVSEILIKAKEKSLFKKRKAFKDGMKFGLSNVTDLFEVFTNESTIKNQNLAQSQKDFFEASIARAEKTLNDRASFIADCDWPSKALLDSYNDDLMRLCYVKSLYGIDVSDMQTFIKNHGGLESVAQKQYIKTIKK